MLGMNLLDGLGAPKDEAKAIEWFKKSADQGNPVALYMLGARHAKGLGVALNKEQARQYWTKAAQLGDSNAAEALKIFR